MPKPSQVKARGIVKVVKKLGFKFRDQNGSHAVYVYADGRKTSIPIHKNSL